MAKKLIGEMLLEKGLLKEEQLKEALQKQTQSSQRLGDILVHLGYVRRGDVEALFEQSSENLLAVDIPSHVKDLINPEFLWKHTILPIGLSGRSVRMAMSDDGDVGLLDDLQFMCGAPIEPALHSEQQILEALHKHFPQEHTPDDSENKTQILGFAQGMSKLVQNIQQGDDPEGPVASLVNLILAEAMKLRSSDIHVEPMKSQLVLRFRIDGVLQNVGTLPKDLHGPLSSRIKLMAGMDIAEKRLPQDGRIRFDHASKNIDLRVSSLPGSYGEGIVLRVLDKSQLLMGLSELGLERQDELLMENFLRTPNGIILVTGPTGSGKTTTLYAALGSLNRPDHKLITVEDPVEYQLSGVNQVQVKEKIGLSFAAALRSILRQSPNVIMIGEIRDLETASITIQAALTGHLVFSTLHTNDAAGAVVRLIDMGVKPYLVSSAVQAIVAQRLVRRICTVCKEEYPADDWEKQALSLSSTQNVTVYRGAGCEHCAGTGYFGRLGLFEILQITEPLRQMIYDNVSAQSLSQHARELGMKSLKADGTAKVLSGLTTVREVLRVTQTQEF